MGWIGGCLIGLGGGWDSPSQLLRGSGTVTGFIPGLSEDGVGWWVPPLGWKGRCDGSGRGLGRYRDLYRVASGWGGLVGAPFGLEGAL